MNGVPVGLGQPQAAIERKNPNGEAQAAAAKLYVPGTICWVPFAYPDPILRRPGDR
jgi:hypothetical protein